MTWVEASSQIRFKTSMLNSSWRDYSDACILEKETIIMFGAVAGAASVASAAVAGAVQQRD